MYIDDLNSEEFVKALKSDPLVIIPVGSIESHGPHIPMSTDSIQAEALAEEIALRIDNVLIAPPLRYGICTSTRPLPGSMSVSFEALHLLVRDILNELSRNGIRNVLVLSSHASGLHLGALRLAADEAVMEGGMKVVVVSDYELLYAKVKSSTDGHAGRIETSRIMALRPELVQKDRRKGRYRAPRYLQTGDPLAFWEGQKGVNGNPRTASAKLGKRYNDMALRDLLKLIRESFSQ